MQKKLINEYDSTKKMLDTLRRLNENRYSNLTINEQAQDQQTSDSTLSSTVGNSLDQSVQSSHMKVNDNVTVINDVDVKILSKDEADMELDEETKNAISSLIDNFKSQVSQIVTFEPGMTVNETQIRLDGTVSDLDIKFTLIAGDESGVYLNAEMLKLDNTVGQVIDRLAKFELSYKQALEPIITQRQNN
jgi:hypothetical protein